MRERGEELSPSPRSLARLHLAEQAEHSLWQLVSLGQDRSTSPLQDLIFGQFRSFSSEVSVTNPAASCRGVLRNVLQVRDCVLETVLNSTELSTLAIDVRDRTVDDTQSVLRTCGRTDVNGIDRVQLTEAISTQTATQPIHAEGISCFKLNLTVSTRTAANSDGSCSTHVIFTVEALRLQSRTTGACKVADADGIATGAGQLNGAAFGNSRNTRFTGFTVDRISQGRQVGQVVHYSRNSGRVSFKRFAGQARQVEGNSARSSDTTQCGNGTSVGSYAGFVALSVDGTSHFTRRTAGCTGNGYITVGQFGIDVEGRITVSTARSGTERSARSSCSSGCTISSKAVDTDTISGCRTDRNADGFVGVCTDLKRLRTKGAVKDLTTTEAGGFRNTVQFLLQLRHFALQCRTLKRTVGTVSRLQGQVTDTLQNASRLLQCTFSSLRKGDTVVGVTRRNVQTVDLAGQTVGNLQAGGVILGAVDTEASGQALQRSVQAFG